MGFGGAELNSPNFGPKGSELGNWSYVCVEDRYVIRLLVTAVKLRGYSSRHFCHFFSVALFSPEIDRNTPNIKISENSVIKSAKQSSRWEND